MTANLPPGVVPGGRIAEWKPEAVRYAVCDVDGTLIGPHRHASDEVVAAVERVQAAGIELGFATGRMRDAVGPLREQLSPSGPCIYHNGAEVRAGDETVAAWTLTREQVDALLAVARRREDAYVEIYTRSGFHVSERDERARAHWELLGVTPTSVVERAAELEGATVLKATFALFDPDAVDDVVALIRNAGMRAGAAGSPLTPHLVYVNATHPDADKGRALIRAAEHLGIELSEVAAIGDAGNDLSMLAVAGTAIAMGQSPPAIRDAAHLVVPDVDDHGVSVALDALRDWGAAV